MSTNNTLTIYSTTWCGPCVRLKAQLDRAGIGYDVIDIELDPAAAQYVQSVNNGSRTVPTVAFPDGTTLTNPSVLAIQDQLAKSA